MILTKIKAKLSSLLHGHVVRYQPKQVSLLGKRITIADDPSFQFMHTEIFQKELFKFNTANQTPFIIDAGANIGLATIYFKQLYPQAKIIAFEPDPKIFRLLQSNIESFNLTGVTLVNRALSKQESSYVSFHTEGADAGRIVSDSEHEHIIQVPTTCLSKYLHERVDFLKMDIEGAEIDVVLEIKEQLHNVDRLFIEYHSFVNESQRLDKLISLLAANKFRIYINTPGLSSNNPFVSIQTYMDMDMQLNIYGIRDEYLTYKHLS